MSLLSRGIVRRTDKWALSIIWGPLFLSLISLILSDTGVFSVRNLFLCVIIWFALAALAYYRWRRRNIEVDQHLHERDSMLLMLLVILPAIFLFARPFQYLRGGWDPGEYVSTAMNISRTGAIEIKDSLLPTLDSDTRKALFHEPEGNRRTVHAGFLVKDEDKGIIVPDYYHLYPAWLSIFAGLFGLEGVYYGQYVIALFAVLAFFLAIREIFGTATAVIASLILVVSPAQIYFSRFTCAEVLAQFLLFSAFYSLARSFRTPALCLDLTAAVALGAAFLCHSTTILPIAGIISFLFITAVYTRKKSAWRQLFLVLLCFAAAFMWNMKTSEIMTKFLFAFIAAHPGLVMPAISFVVLVLAGAGVILRVIKREKSAFLEDELLMRWIPSLLLAFAGLFLYFVRPRLYADPESRNFILLSRLISPVALTAFFLFFFRQKWSKFTPAQWLFLIAGGLTSAVLIGYKMAHPLLMWSIRRYVPIVLPFFVSLAAGFIGAWIISADWRKKVVSASVFATIIVYLAYQSYPIIRVTEYKGQPEFLRRVASHVENADFILCDHWKYSTPLRYAFGLPAYQWSRQDAAVGAESLKIIQLLRDKTAKGENVYYITVGGCFFDPSFYLEEIAYEESESSSLVRTRTKLPRVIEQSEERARVYRACGIAGEFQYRKVPHRIDIGYHSLGLKSGFHEWAKGQEESYRWTDGRGEVYLPSFGTNSAVRCVLRLASKRPPELGQTVPTDILVDGNRVGRLNVEKEWKEYEVVLPAGCASNATMLLSLVSPTWNPADYQIFGYPTNLGVRVDWIEIEPIQR